jgi:hypothetical protein
VNHNQNRKPYRELRTHHNSDNASFTLVGQIELARTVDLYHEKQSWIVPGLIGIDGETCVFPCVETTQQGSCVFDTLSFQICHRTGGRVFVWSRTVGDN